jgi:hypothetical protein
MVARRARSYYLCCALLMSPFIGTIFERSGALDSAVILRLFRNGH